MDEKIQSTLKNTFQSSKNITILTGAGISAESGIPTFRGPEGYWSIGAKEYHPQEMATYSMFCRQPDEVWKWYLYRMGICQGAAPNPGHLALVDMEDLFQDRFTLVTQNVDGLHLRAGNSLDRTWQIHGNVSYMRCAQECSVEVYPIPATVSAKTKDESLTESDKEALRCPRCCGPSRPHILWFDESYNEHHYHFDSSIQAAQETDLLIIVGTSGATNLPNQVATQVKSRGGIIIDINIEENPFTDLALQDGNGFFIKETSTSALPAIVDVLTG